MFGGFIRRAGVKPAQGMEVAGGRGQAILAKDRDLYFSDWRNRSAAIEQVTSAPKPKRSKSEVTLTMSPE